MVHVWVTEEYFVNYLILFTSETYVGLESDMLGRRNTWLDAERGRLTKLNLLNMLKSFDLKLKLIFFFNIIIILVQDLYVWNFILYANTLLI